MKRAGGDIEFISLEDLQNENLLIRKKIRAGYFDKICFSAVTPIVPACATFAEYEQIYKDNKLIYELHCSGGIIE